MNKNLLDRLGEIESKTTPVLPLAILFYDEHDSKPVHDNALIFKVLQPVKPELIKVCVGC